MNKAKKNLWNAAQEPVHNLNVAAPFYVEASGINYCKKGEIHHKRGMLNQFAGFSWILSGTMEMYDGPKLILAGPNHIHFNLQGDDTWCKIISEECIYRWVAFSGPLAEAVLLSYRYARHQVSQHQYPEKLFETLDALMNGNSSLQIRLRMATILEILAYAEGIGYGVSDNQRIIDGAISLIKQNLADPALDVHFLCESLKVSQSTLNRVFHMELAVSPGRHILNLRLQRGIGLLKGTDLGIAVVSEKCGFRDAKTFSRFIRRGTAYSARDFRKYSKTGLLK